MYSPLRGSHRQAALSAGQAQVVDEVFLSMVDFFAGEPQRIQHFVSVYDYASYLADQEQISGLMRMSLELACMVHDIGKVEHAPYRQMQSSAQSDKDMQTVVALMRALHEYSPEASALRGELTEELIDLVCVLVQNYGVHSGDVSSEPVLQILREADSLVHFKDENLDPSDIVAYVEYFFKTKSGRELAHILYAPYFAAAFPLPVIDPKDIPYLKAKELIRQRDLQKERLNNMPLVGPYGYDHISHAVDNVLRSSEDIEGSERKRLEQRAEILRQLSPYQQRELKQRLKQIKSVRQQRIRKAKAAQAKAQMESVKSYKRQQMDVTESIMGIDLDDH